MPKYKILKNEKTDFCDRTLYRIKALKDFTLIDGKEIKAGDLGGYVESEKNLSQEGNCWISDNAKVYGNACVFDNACISDNARVFDKAKVFGKSRVGDNAMVGNNADIRNDTDYLYVKGFGTSSYRITFYKCKDNHIEVNYNFFTGTLNEFISYLKNTDENTKFGKELLSLVEAVKIHFQS